MEKIYTAKTEELAKEQAINEFRALGISESDISFEILEQPVKKLFGGLKGEFRIRASAADQIAAADNTEEETPAAAHAETAAPADAAEDGMPEQTVSAPADGIDVLETEKVKNAIAYLSKILDTLGLSGYTINAVKSEDTVVLDIVGDKLGVIIGRRGETLDALQYLTILASNKAQTAYCRIAVDCNGYREKRKETLEALAEKTAHRVLKQGRRITLEPMNPYERRIIHSKVAQIEGVFSNSIGEEPFRKVVISSNVKPSYSQNRDRDRDRGGKRGGSRTPSGKSYRQSAGFSTSFEREYKRSHTQPQPSADDDNTEISQETVDIEKSTTLYGKIIL